MVFYIKSVIFRRYVPQEAGNLRKLTPRWLMSNLANQFFNAWVGVMGGKPKRLFCTWHVDKAWQTELRVKVKDTGKFYLDRV